MNQTATLNQNEIREIYNNNTQTLYNIEKSKAEWSIYFER